ncbi:MAG: type 1 glutamine amidotransferase domain-containing protein [Candidatus Dormibacteria bacterium]
MKIACLLAEQFEDSEFQEPYERFQLAGHVVTVIGTEAHQQLTGEKGTVTTSTDQAIGEVRPEDFGALFLPGGRSPEHLSGDQRVLGFVQEFMDHEKPVLAICHGPELLLSAHRVDGRRMTATPSVQGNLRAAGSEVVDEPAVVDRNLVTARRPGDLPEFLAASLELIGA